ncbi:MAG: isopeptide-forming domain-containing fimbrial protein [Solobacterium sp.]|nr:isopeptide-forming domain-containing fimbrial protein [Solobacterium sp.]
MKQIKRIMAAVVVAVMTMGLFVTTAWAEPKETTIKVTPVEGHTYTAYQLFTGDLAEDGKTLSNIKWGSNAASSIKYKTKDGSGEYTVDATTTATAGEAVPPAVLEYLESLASKTDTDPAQATANVIGEWVTGTGVEITSTETTVLTGYYVVKDEYTEPAADQTTTLSTIVCEVVGPTTVTPKAGTTEHKKDVLDVNDSTDTIDLTNLKDISETSWVKYADYDFGDKVPFRLTTKIGSDFAKYNSYFLSVHDTLGSGLSLVEDSIKVYVDGTLATKGTEDGQYQVVTNGQSFEVKFTKLNGNEKAAAGKDVVVYYTATLTDNAQIGNPGNPNESYAEFSNNPNGEQEGTADTPKDKVVVFTYKFDVDKIAKNSNETEYEAKTGAGFTLYKQYASEQTDKGENQAANLGKPDTEFWYAVGAEKTGATNFVFDGLDDGNYILKETTTPDGYNTMDDLAFAITATITADTDATHGYKITALSGPTGFAASADGGEFTFKRPKADGTGDEDVTTKIDGTTNALVSGEIFGQIINQKGSVLPSTGGIGTTVFYIIGSALVLGAGVLLATKKKAAN